MTKALTKTRFAPSLIALLLGCSAMSGSAHAWSLFGSDTAAAPTSKTVADAKPAAPAANLEDSVRQAQLLRLAGDYPEAVRHLSQLMMVASDDPRVVSEYGKTLASQGRAQEAINFLTRAQQLQPGEWTNYSAMGVAYDQMGNQKDAQAAYERALQIKPGEPSVLSNYALSRLLAKDTDMARRLATSAEAAGGTNDPKIARNIALVKELAPAPAASATASIAAPVTPVASKPVATPRQLASAPLQALPQAQPQTIARAAAPQPSAPFVNIPAPPPVASAPIAAPHAQVATVPMIQAMPEAAQPRTVVMQRVPVDPLAGPVQSAAKAHDKIATHAPRTLAPAASKAVATVAPVAPGPDTQANALQARAEALAKAMSKPEVKAAAAVSVAPKPVAPVKNTPVKAAQTRPVETKTASAKPAPAKPAAPVKSAAAPAKDAVPALRMSANAY